MLAQKHIKKDPTPKLTLHRKGKKEEKTHQVKHKKKVYWNKNNLLVR
jgi:hypothetical protein